MLTEKLMRTITCGLANVSESNFTKEVDRQVAMAAGLLTRESGALLAAQEFGVSLDQIQKRLGKNTMIYMLIGTKHPKPQPLRQALSDIEGIVLELCPDNQVCDETCDCDPNGYDGCVTRKILQIIRATI